MFTLSDDDITHIKNEVTQRMFFWEQTAQSDSSSGYIISFRNKKTGDIMVWSVGKTKEALTESLYRAYINKPYLQNEYEVLFEPIMIYE